MNWLLLQGTHVARRRTLASDCSLFKSTFSTIVSLKGILGDSSLFIMVFLGPPGGEIEVRLVKPPFDAVESARIYFDEYEKLGTPHAENLSYKSTRYIVPENTQYAIELTLKKGFDYEEWEGIYVKVYNKVKMSEIGGKKLPKPLGQRDLLHSVKKILVDRFDHAPKDGNYTMNATLTFRALDTGTFI
jgi:hypothetical protein